MGFQFFKHLSNCTYQNICKCLLQPDLALKHNAPNSKTLAFVVCTENPVGNLKSYAVKSYFILQKHCHVRGEHEPPFKIEFDKETYSLRRCNELLFV